VEDCANGVKNDPDCLTGQFDFNQAYNGQCKCVVAGGDSMTNVCTPVKGLKNYNTYQVLPTVALPKGVVLKNTDRYWNCARMGIANRHGFGFKSVQACAEVKKEPLCTTGQFDYNRKYNGQCKCVTVDECLNVRGIRGYNTYQIEPWAKRPAPAPPPPAETTTTTTICVAGTEQEIDLCSTKTCIDDGSSWMTSHEDCPEDEGATCPEGEVYVTVAGECCKKCMFEACTEEGAEGTDECPAGCAHVEDEDECKMAAAAGLAEGEV